MRGGVSDTHSALWYLLNQPELSLRAKRIMRVAETAGDPIFVPSICLVEATYLAEKVRIEAFWLEKLTAALRSPDSGFRPETVPAG